MPIFEPLRCVDFVIESNDWQLKSLIKSISVFFCLHLYGCGNRMSVNNNNNNNHYHHYHFLLTDEKLLFKNKMTCAYTLINVRNLT